jgi:hypothetical protein
VLSIASAKYEKFVPFFPTNSEENFFKPQWLAELDEARMRKADAKRRARESRNARNASARGRRHARINEMSDADRAVALVKIQKQRDARAEYEPKSKKCRLEERFNQGFVWYGGYVADRKDCWRDGFIFRGLVSKNCPISQLFSAKVNRAADLRVGHDKAAVEITDSKVFSLDYEYVQVNGVMRGVLRVDLDAIFPNWHALITGLRSKVPLPNFVVGHERRDGSVLRPHAIWILADSVNMGPNGRPGPQDLLRAVERGLIAALASIGADPGGMSNATKVKNPLCPLWSRRVLVEEPYRLSSSGGDEELPALADRVTLVNDLGDAVSRYAEFVAPEGVDTVGADKARTPSNEVFWNLRQHAFAEIVAARDAGASRDEFILNVCQHAMALVGIKSEKQALAIASKVAAWTFDNFDPSRRQAARPNRGICRSLVAGVQGLAERQAIGGRYIAARTREASLDLIVAAVDALVEQGVAVNHPAVVARSGLSLSTVERRIKEAFQRRLARQEETKETAVRRPLTRCEVKKEIFHPGVVIPGQASCQRVKAFGTGPNQHFGEVPRAEPAEAQPLGWAIPPAPCSILILHRRSSMSSLSAWSLPEPDYRDDDADGVELRIPGPLEADRFHDIWLRDFETMAA